MYRSDSVTLKYQHPALVEYIQQRDNEESNPSCRFTEKKNKSNTMEGLSHHLIYPSDLRTHNSTLDLHAHCPHYQKAIQLDNIMITELRLHWLTGQIGTLLIAEAWEKLPFAKPTWCVYKNETYHSKMVASAPDDDSKCLSIFWSEFQNAHLAGGEKSTNIS